MNRFLFSFLLLAGCCPEPQRQREGEVYKPFGEYVESVLKRHGYQEEELMIELSNENGVSLWSAANKDIYYVWVSTDKHYRYPIQIIKRTWK